MSFTDAKLIIAHLKLKPASEGGRKSPIRNSYRPNHVFDYKEGQPLQTYIGEIQFDEHDKIYPGEERDVFVLFLLFTGVEKYLQIGRKWWIHEGGQVIGEAEITSL